jgi:hypothetical protein
MTLRLAPRRRRFEKEEGSKESADFIRSQTHFSARSRWVRFAGARITVCLSVLNITALGLATSHCGTQHANLEFSAPATVTAGTPFTVTVTVMLGSERDTMINNRVHFTSSDPAALLPGDYYFTPADAGSHSWANGFVLRTPGNQTISGEIVEATGISGSAHVTVVP